MRPDSNKKVKCKLCGERFQYNRLSTHLSRIHEYDPKRVELYYRKHYAEDGEGQCAHCKEPTRFKSMSQGYCEICSTSCQMHLRFQDPEFLAYWRKKKSKDQSDYLKTESGKRQLERTAKVSSARMKEFHKDTEFQTKVSTAASKGLRKAWANPEKREAMSRASREGRSTPEFRRKRSAITQRMLQDPDSRFGYRFGKVHEYSGYRLRSSWELRFAKQLDECKMPWEYECRSFRLRLESGKVTAYTPDFYLPEFDLYVEIKPMVFVNDLAVQKVARMRQKGYNVGFVTETNWASVIARIKKRDKALNKLGRAH